MRSRVVVVTWCAVAWLACPPEMQPDAGPAPDAGDVVDAYCSAVAEATCTRLGACGETDVSGTCRGVMFDACVRRIGDDVRSGHRRFVPGALAPCVAQVAAAECAFIDQSVSSFCFFSSSLEAAAPPGAKCEPWRSECERGGCARINSSTTCGVCPEPSAIGQPCGTCDEREAFCNANGVCQALLADGEACGDPKRCSSRVCSFTRRCGRSGRGGECHTSLSCEPDDYCKDMGLEPIRLGTCAARIPANAACQFSEGDELGGCARGFGCVDGQCRALAERRPDGAECLTHSQCAGGVCVDFTPLQRAGACATPVVDGPCAGFSRRCPLNARCVEGVCRALGRYDAPCTLNDSEDDCSVGLSCVAHEGSLRCRAPLPLRGACTEAHQCASGRCSQNICWLPAPAGVRCSTSSECESRSCTVGSDSTLGTCSEVCR